MTAQNLFKGTGDLAWVADADEVGAPAGVLLRADNLVPDETGAMALRKGSSVLYSGLVQQRVHSLRTVIIGGTRYRFFGADDRLYKDGADLGVTFDGSGDIALGDDSFQFFAARGQSKKKFDGTALREWGIAAPALAPSLQAVASIFATIATFASGESPAVNVNEGSGAFIANYAGTANAALQLTPSPTTGRASASKVFASDQDFFAIGGGDGSDTDLFDIYVYLQEPRKVETITIMFGLGTGSDAFLNDYYYFDFKLPNAPTGASTVDVKDASSQAATAYTTYLTKVQGVLDPKSVTDVKTPLEVSTVLKALGRFTGPRSRERKDASEASPAWTHFSVTRGQFNRIGGTAGRNWSTIRAFKVVYVTVPGSSEVGAFSSAILMGGGARSMTGKYICGYRFVRDTGNYIELSPISPVSPQIVLTQQALRVTIPAAAISGADPQANQIWVYLFGGFLDAFYRFAVTSPNASSSTQRIDEFAKSADGAIDAADRTRLLNQGLSIPGFTPNLDLTIDILKSELDALIENERLEPGAVGPPDQIVGIAGPHMSRMFVVTQDGWVYPSSDTSPSNFSAYWALDLRRWGTPLWMVRTTSGVLVGMTKDVIFIDGSGDTSADQISVDLFPRALGVGNPPVDACVFTDGNAVVYRGSDDLMTLSGIALTPVDQGQVELLWRGRTRHGVSPLNLTTGRFRLAVSKHILFMLAPEGSDADGTSVIWRYGTKRWSRTTYPKKFLSITREPDGTIVAGTTDGALWKLEDGTQDNFENLPVRLTTPFSDGGNPLARKDPFDLQIHAESDGSTGTINLYFDGSAVVGATYPFSLAASGIYRINLEGLQPFTRLKFELTGAFSTLRVRAFNVSYRPRPQQVMAVDTGYILPQAPRKLVWIREVLLDCITPVDIVLAPYADDVAKPTILIPATDPNRRTVYRVSFPRGGLKARRPRLRFKTTNANGAGDIGFEPYMVRVLHRATGYDAPEKPWQTVWPVPGGAEESRGG